MLQRAASNAYSWWWASHIRTKQSKWLEQNLHDMEEKVNSMLKIIDEDGDSFAKRAEMYYRKRPVLVGHVEESFRAYRALAERYDHLSKELQRANRTIASIFPERVQYSIDDDINAEENLTESSYSSFKSEETAIDLPDGDKPGIPRVPKLPEYFRTSSILRKAPMKNATSSAKSGAIPKSGLSKREAVEEIDKLHKEILALQTEKEFVKSLYERGCQKYVEIENQITEMEKKASSLQDEFGLCTAIEDDEARTIMATTALRSCQETLIKLREKKEQSADEARAEYSRIEDVRRKFETVRDEFISKRQHQRDFNADAMGNDVEEERHENEITMKKAEKQLDENSNKSLTVIELADKVDELVNKVVNLETEVTSQTASVKRLKSETDVLHAHVQSLEEDKEILLENSDNLSSKLKELEELSRVKNLKSNVENLNNDLLSHFTEANSNLDHLSGILQTVKMEEENTGNFNDDNGPQTISESLNEEEENKLNQIQINSTKNDVSEKVNANLDAEKSKIAAEEENQPNWRQMFLKDLEDRENILLDYTSVLQDFRDFRNKLSEEEEKNRNNVFELALQIRGLKNVISSKDEEIKSLHQKSRTSVRNPEEPEEIMNDTSCSRSHFSGTPSPISNQDIFSEYSEDIVGSAGTINESPETSISSQEKEKESKLNVDQVGKITAISATKERLRSSIDELLEENLEFWQRFSTSFHQIQKFQTSIQDLLAELARTKEITKRKGGTRQQIIQSDVRPTYQHLREIQTEFSLWSEHNAVLKDELQGRLSSLCNIEDEISRLSNRVTGGEKAELSDYQAAKFQGEILNMKRENSKSSDELLAGLNRMRELEVLVEKTLLKLDKELGISAPKNNTSAPKNSINRAGIPLRSFLFGVKLKRQKASIFSCVNPALQKQYSDLAAGLSS